MNPLHVGSTVGRLTIVSDWFYRPGTKNAVAKCVCECGGTCEPQRNRLERGTTRSCGCWRKDKRTTHGLWGGRAYKSWSSMRQRTTNPKNPDWPYYGGRGIKCCPEWASFESFLASMGHPPEGTSLDRIAPDGDYTPENCRWATKTTQARNRRPRANGLQPEQVERIRQIGSSRSQASIAADFGVSQTIISRILRGKNWVTHHESV